MSQQKLTVFAGYRKPWAGQMDLIKAIAVQSLVGTVKSITREDLLAQGWPGRSKGPWRPLTLLSP